MTELLDRDHYVYRAFDARGRLLYVGRTWNVDARFAAHRTSSGWWAGMARHTVEGPMRFTAAAETERRAIDTEEPLWNMDTPHRVRMKGYYRGVYSCALTLAGRDGWWANDVHDIARSTARFVLPYYLAYGELHASEQYRAQVDYIAFMDDQLPYVWGGYRRLLDAGWEPSKEYPSTPRFILLPEYWDPSERGRLPTSFRL